MSSSTLALISALVIGSTSAQAQPSIFAKLKRGHGYGVELSAEGYVMGEIHDVARVGFPRSSEAAIHVGGIGGPIYIEVQGDAFVGEDEHAALDGSEHGSETKGKGARRIVVTPFHFSVDDENHEKVEEYRGRMTLTHYIERHFKDPFLDTPREWVDTLEIRAANFHPLQMEVRKGAHNLHAHSTFHGRIVHLTYQGNPFVKTWEAIVQLGDQHSHSFVTMSIRDHRLARYAILAMQSGVALTISYTQTGFVIPGVEPVWRAMRELNPLAIMRFSESNYDIYRISQVLRKGTDKSEFRIIPKAVFESSKVDLDEYMRTYLAVTPSSHQ